MILDEIKESYNKIPYNSITYKNSLPQRQKVILKMFNFETPKLENARVLEMGCSFGANIMSYAMSYKDSECIGIDISNIEIEKGQEIIKKLEIDNLKLYEMNILDYKNEFGKFDYIICHGVFSWVPEIVQRKILEIISSSLVENGSAVISYNAYPGWKFQEVIKEAVDYRIKNSKILENNFSFENRIECLKDTAKFLKKNSTYNKDKIEVLNGIEVSSYDYLYHEYFTGINIPFYLYKFNNLLNEYGLKHIVDSSLYISFPIYASDIYDKNFNNISNHIDKEQHYDYMYNRNFRHSIITHYKNEIKVTDEINVENIDKIYIRSNFNKKNGIYNFKNIKFSNIEMYEKILDYIYKCYPNFIKIKDISEKFLMNFSDLYLLLVNLILAEEVEYISENINIIDTEILKINNKYRKYLEYLLNDEGNKYIKIGDFLGNINNDLSLIDLKNMLLFNGTRTDNEIIEILKKYEIFENEEEINEYIFKLRRFIVESKYNE